MLSHTAYTRRRFYFGAFAVAIAASTALGEERASFPSQTVKIVVPFTPGSITDILARTVGDKLSALWAQTVLIENRLGIPGVSSVATAAPDGYTLLFTSNGHAILNLLNKSATLDPVRDFSAITQIASIPLVLIVPPDSPAKTLGDLVSLAKEKPGQINFTSAGLASSNYIAGELFKQSAKVDIVHVPFRGTQEQLTSIMRGDSQMSLAFLGTALPLIETGKVRALAVTSEQRHSSIPQVPTFAEAGMPDFRYDAWFGMLGPAGMAERLRVKISADVASVLGSPELRAQWSAQGTLAVPTSPDAFSAVLRSDAERYAKLLQAAGVLGSDAPSNRASSGSSAQ